MSIPNANSVISLKVNHFVVISNENTVNFSCTFLLTKACRIVECLLTLPPEYKYWQTSVLAKWQCIAIGALIKILKQLHFSDLFFIIKKKTKIIA